jgi:uncharacterized protein YqfA (UPF0365 family)
MNATLPLLAQAPERLLEAGLLWLIGIAIVLIAALVIALVLFSYGKLWLQALMSNAYVSLFSLIGMSLRQVHARTIVEAKIKAMQAGVGTDPQTGITTRRLEAHYLAGGNVPRVIHALIAAHRPTSTSISIAQPPSTWRGAMCSMPCGQAFTPR